MTLRWPESYVSLVDTVLEEKTGFADAFGAIAGFLSAQRTVPIQLIQALIAVALDPAACTSDRKPFKTADPDDPIEDTNLRVKTNAIELLAASATINYRDILRALPYTAGLSAIELHGLSQDLKYLDALAKGKGKQVESDEDDSAAQKAALRVASSQNLWTLLSYGIKRTAEKSLSLSDMEWRLLSVVVETWREESSSLQGWSPSLLVQFPKPVTGKRVDVAEALDVVFQAFQSQNPSQPARSRSICGNVEEVAIRLLSEVGRLGLCDKIDMQRLLRECCSRLRELDGERFRAFLASACAWQCSIILNLMAFYMDVYSKQRNLPEVETRSRVPLSPQRRPTSDAESSQSSTVSSSGDRSYMPGTIYNDIFTRRPSEAANSSGWASSLLRHAQIKAQYLLMVSCTTLYRSQWVEFAQSGRLDDIDVYDTLSRAEVSSLLAPAQFEALNGAKIAIDAIITELKRA